MNEKTLYFAYGSNLDLVGMHFRAPTARRVGPATLERWRLTFRGVADIEPSPEDVVQGALWELDSKCVASLDRYEGHPHYYQQREVTARDAFGKEVAAMTYVMLPEYQHKEGLPTRHYFQSIVHGYEAFKLPLGELLAVIERIEHDSRMDVGGRPWRRAVKPTDSMSPATRALYALEEVSA